MNALEEYEFVENMLMHMYDSKLFRKKESKSSETEGTIWNINTIINDEHVAYKIYCIEKGMTCERLNDKSQMIYGYLLLYPEDKWRESPCNAFDKRRLWGPYHPSM